MRKVYFAGLTVALLTACATSSQQEIDRSADLYYYSMACAKAGLMSKDTAAKGIALANSNVYSGATQEFRDKIVKKANAEGRPSKDQCENTELGILAGDINRRTTAATPAPRTSPSFTTCNTAFNQTSCTTF